MPAKRAHVACKLTVALGGNGMLIRAYGEFWNPNLVAWGSRGRGNVGTLIGCCKIDGALYDVDFWNAVGIYVLYDKFRPVYVGKAFGESTRIGGRLRTHLTDRFSGRWDMFSWYSLSTINKTTRNTRAPGIRQLGSDVVTDTLESLAIAIMDPPLNRRHEVIPEATEAEQVGGDPKSIRQYLEEILKKLNE